MEYGNVNVKIIAKVYCFVNILYRRPPNLIVRKGIGLLPPPLQLSLTGTRSYTCH
jgi:hypothetical protein